MENLVIAISARFFDKKQNEAMVDFVFSLSILLFLLDTPLFICYTI